MNEIHWTNLATSKKKDAIIRGICELAVCMHVHVNVNVFVCMRAGDIRDICATDRISLRIVGLFFPTAVVSDVKKYGYGIFLKLLYDS